MVVAPVSAAIPRYVAASVAGHPLAGARRSTRPVWRVRQARCQPSLNVSA